MYLKVIAAAVIAVLVVVGMQFAQHRHHQPAPIVAAPIAKPVPVVPLPKPRPKMPTKAPAHKPAAKPAAPVAVDCSLVDWAKQMYNKETLKQMAASHPDEAKAAKACQ